MGNQTSVTLDGRHLARVEGIPSIRREGGRLWLDMDRRSRVDLDALPLRSRIEMALLGRDGSFEGRDIARLRRGPDGAGITVESAEGDWDVPEAGPDAIMSAFAPHAVDLLVDGVVRRTLAVEAEYMAAGVGLSRLEALVTAAGGRAVGTMVTRPARRLPWELGLPPASGVIAGLARRGAATARRRAAAVC